MPEIQYEIQDGKLILQGPCTLVTQPDIPAAFTGAVEQKNIPMLPGTAWNWFYRLFTPDRFRLRMTSFTGKAWLAKGDAPWLSILEVAEPVSIITSHLVACPLEARASSRLFRIVPGTTAGAICVTTISRQWVAVASESTISGIQVEKDETLSVNRNALVAWCGAEPSSFCPKLRLRDIFLPKLPGNLAILFKGPAQVWIQAPKPFSMKKKS